MVVHGVKRRVSSAMPAAFSVNPMFGFCRASLFKRVGCKSQSSSEAHYVPTDGDGTVASFPVVGDIRMDV